MIKTLFSFFFSFADAAEPWQISPQDPATPSMEGMIFFHDYLMCYVVAIGFIVCWILWYIYENFNSENTAQPKKLVNFSHHSLLEIIWTLIPAILLVAIAIPSFSLLYSLDDVVDPSVTVKIVGHQWYWSYEISDKYNSNSNEGLFYDSYMLTDDSADFLSVRGRLRLLETDLRLVLPIRTHIRLLITSADVLHSWAVPSLGIKVDACPGRLSQASLFLLRNGTFFGQCSEICGVNHGFMPIVVYGVGPRTFLIWLNSMKNMLAS